MILYYFQSKHFLFNYRLVSEARKITSKIRLSDFYFKPDIVQRQDNYDSFTRGLLTQPAQEVDQYYTVEVYTGFSVHIIIAI